MIGHVSSRWEWGQWDARLPDLPARPERNGGKSTDWSGRGAGEREGYGEGLKPISDLFHPPTILWGMCSIEYAPTLHRAAWPGMNRVSG